MFKKLVLFIATLLLLTNTYGQKTDQSTIVKNLDDLIYKRYAEIAPGCVVLVAKKGNTIYKKAFGTSNIIQNSPMQSDMIFRIGSITKQFTAIAILQLVEQGKIALNDSIQKYVKDFPSREVITIENLLTQTSGIKNYFEISNPSKTKTTYTPAQGVDYFKDEPLVFFPGSRFQYSNSNYYLLGYIIEIVTGKSYAAYLRENILSKLPLINTSYDDPDKQVVNMTKGYSKFDGKIEQAELEEISTIYSAGGLLSNAEDLLKWNQYLYAGKLISKQLLTRAISPFQLSDGSFSSYGYGLYIKGIEGIKTIEHSGSTDGFQSDLIYLPDEDITVITLFNCYEADMDWQILSNDIVKVTLGKSVESLFVLNKDSLRNYIGVYEFNPKTKLEVTLENDQLFIKCTNPAVRLPKVRLIPESEYKFGIREVAELKFEFIMKNNGKAIKIVTYNSRGKDAEWEIESP
ncbi:serine hydrolase [Flavitalea sp.]|nr:serine hydrolase [Flavitalea sp.]